MKHLRLFSLSLLAAISLTASEDILNDKKQKNLEYEKQSTEINAEILQNSWINPLNLSVGKSYDRQGAKTGESESTTATLSFNQDIFRSGGIWYAIEYAKAQKKLGLSNVELNKNSQIVAAYSALVEIKKLELSEKKQRLLIRNSEIDIKRKRDQYAAGLIDISFLNNAILTKTSQENALLDMLTSKENLIVSFESVSDKDYKSVDLPDLKMPSMDEYIEANLALKSKKGSIDSTKYYAKMTKAKYLPKLTANAYYTQSEVETDTATTDDSYNGYGLTLSIPLDINTFKDIEVAKLESLIAKNSYDLAAVEENKGYERVAQDIKRIERKIELAKSDSKLYGTLLKQTKELYQAGLNTKEDLETMENSKSIREIDQGIYSLEKLGKKLEIYTKLADGF